MSGLELLLTWIWEMKPVPYWREDNPSVSFIVFYAGFGVVARRLGTIAAFPRPARKDINEIGPLAQFDDEMARFRSSFPTS
jgi:hypothetical protein